MTVQIPGTEAAKVGLQKRRLLATLTVAAFCQHWAKGVTLNLMDHFCLPCTPFPDKIPLLHTLQPLIAESWRGLRRKYGGFSSRKSAFWLPSQPQAAAHTGEQQFDVRVWNSSAALPRNHPLKPNVPSLVMQGAPADLHSPEEHEGLNTHLTTKKTPFIKQSQRKSWAEIPKLSPLRVSSNCRLHLSKSPLLAQLLIKTVPGEKLSP